MFNQLFQFLSNKLLYDLGFVLFSVYGIVFLFLKFFLFHQVILSFEEITNNFDITHKLSFQGAFMDYNENIVNIVRDYSLQIGFDFNLIQRIHIIAYEKVKEWYGKVVPIMYNNNLYFELLFCKNLINDLLFNDNTKLQLSKSIIIHELFHCKEMYITSRNIDCNKLYFHEPIVTTKMLLFDTAIKQWSEYYAYYNSSKYGDRQINLSNYICEVNTSLKVMYNKLVQTQDVSDVQMPISFITDIIDFIHRCIMLIAYYNSTHDKKYKNELEYFKRSLLYKDYYPYLKDLSYTFNNLYRIYPNWLSELSFIELGYKLFSFIHINKLTFTTNDLSDNFMLKLI